MTHKWGWYQKDQSGSNQPSDSNYSSISLLHNDLTVIWTIFAYFLNLLSLFLSLISSILVIAQSIKVI